MGLLESGQPGASSFALVPPFFDFLCRQGSVEGAPIVVNEGWQVAGTVGGAGLIGFVGLIVPAIARALGCRGARATVLASALAGGTLVVLADLGARTAMAPAELPLGAVTALVGVPFFLWRLRAGVTR